MADDQPLGEYLDYLIQDVYTATQRGIGTVSRYPLHSAVIEYIEDESTGRPVPIDDAADRFLLRAFDRVRAELAGVPLVHSSERGERRGNAFSSVKIERVDAIAGSIPWRCFHGDPDWPCVECGHAARMHDDDGASWDCCLEDDCNCGNNVGR